MRTKANLNEIQEHPKGSGNYRVRVQVPAECQDRLQDAPSYPRLVELLGRIPGKTQLSQPLGRVDKHEAERLGSPWRSLFNRVIEEARPVRRPWLQSVMNTLDLIENDPSRLRRTFAMQPSSPAIETPMIDVTPAAEIGLEVAIADWKRWHGPWRDAEAEKKQTRAKERAAESLFKHAGTTNMAAIDSDMLQAWKDTLDGRVAYDYVLAVNTLYGRLKANRRFELAKLNTDYPEVELPRKPDHKGRSEFNDTTAAKIIDAAKQSDDPLIKWGTVIMAKLGMIISEFVYAPTSEIKLIGGVLCWWVGEKRMLKTGNRGRVMPIPQDMLDMGFEAFVRSRGDGLLFDIDNTRASNTLMDFLRGLGIHGDDQVNYSWRHRFISGLVARGIDPTLRRYLDGHGLKSHTDERHYIHHHLPEMIEAVDPGRRMAA